MAVNENSCKAAGSSDQRYDIAHKSGAAAFPVLTIIAFVTHLDAVASQAGTSAGGS